MFLYRPLSWIIELFIDSYTTHKLLHRHRTCDKNKWYVAKINILINLAKNSYHIYASYYRHTQSFCTSVPNIAVPDSHKKRVEYEKMKRNLTNAIISWTTHNANTTFLLHMITLFLAMTTQNTSSDSKTHVLAAVTSAQHYNTEGELRIWLDVCTYYDVAV